MNTAQLKKQYKEQIVPALQKQFNYSSAMQVPVLKKIVINQGLGDATQDKKIIEVAVNEISSITGQKAVRSFSILCFFGMFLALPSNCKTKNNGSIWNIRISTNPNIHHLLYRND